MNVSSYNTTCTTATTCAGYTSQCYPCSWPNYGVDCLEVWSSINNSHQLIACLLYSCIGFAISLIFIHRLWPGRHHLQKLSGWRTIDKLWGICWFASIMYVPRFMTKPHYSKANNPELIFSNMFDIITTLSLVHVEILMVTEWVSIMKVKGRVNSKSNNLIYAQNTAFACLWIISLTACILEQAVQPKLGEPNIPVKLTGGSLFNFKGTYNTTWNAIKNLNHGTVGVIYASIGIWSGRSIIHQMKTSQSEKAKKVITKIFHYLWGTCFCVCLNLAYGVITAASRLSNGAWFQDFPPCSVVSEYIYSADLLKIIVFSVLLYLTRGSERKATGTPRHSSTRSISMNAYKSEEIGDNQSKKLNPAESSSTSKYVATTPPLTPSESIISMDASTEILNSVGST